MNFINIFKIENIYYYINHIINTITVTILALAFARASCVSFSAWCDPCFNMPVITFEHLLVLWATREIYTQYKDDPWTMYQVMLMNFVEVHMRSNPDHITLQYILQSYPFYFKPSSCSDRCVKVHFLIYATWGEPEFQANWNWLMEDDA